MNREDLARCGEAGHLCVRLRGMVERIRAILRPEDVGALTLCFGCGRPYQVGEGLTMLPVDLDAMPIDPEHRREIRRLQRAIVTMRGRQS